MVTKGLVLPAQYKVSVEVWDNTRRQRPEFNDTGGTNSTTGQPLAWHRRTSYDGATTNAIQGGVLVDAIRDPLGVGRHLSRLHQWRNQGNSNDNF